MSCHALFLYRRAARVPRVLLLKTAIPRNSPRRREPESRAVTARQEKTLHTSGPPWWAKSRNLHIYICFDWTVFSYMESGPKRHSILADAISKLRSMKAIIDIISSKLELFIIYMTDCSYYWFGSRLFAAKGLTCFSLCRKLRNKSVIYGLDGSFEFRQIRHRWSGIF